VIRLFAFVAVAVCAALTLAILFGAMPPPPPPSGLRYGISLLAALPHPTTTAGWALAVATTGLFSLIGLFSQLGETRRRFRADIAPYLRIDLAPGGIGGTWSPPDASRIGSDLTFPDLNGGRSREQSPLDDWAGATPIYLWVENRQTGTAGIADNVQVGIEFRFPDRTDPTTYWRDYHEVRFSYLEAEHLNRYEIARIDPQIPSLEGVVVAVRYETMFRRYSTWAHGSAGFSLVDGRVTNDRVAFREREGRLGRQRDRLAYWWHSLRRG